MLTRRLIPAFVVALLMAALFTWLLGRRMTRPVAAASVPMQHLVAAAADLKVGDTLTPGSLKMIDWPATATTAGTFTRPQDVTGRVLLYPVAAGQPMLDRLLAPTGTGSGLMARIPAGMRAITVHADEISGVAGFVAPDSFVDVLVTSKTGGPEQSATSTLLEDVHVLAIGQRLDVESPDKATDKSPLNPLNTAGEAITLLLSPRDARRLTQASSDGKILLVLRNGADRALDPTVEMAAKVPAHTLPNNAGAAVMPRRLPQAVEVPFTVQTIAGGKQTDQNFAGVR